MRALPILFLFASALTLGAAEPDVPPVADKVAAETRTADRRFRKPRDYAQQARQRIADRREALRAELLAVRERRNNPQTPAEEPPAQESSDGSNVN